MAAYNWFVKNMLLPVSDIVMGSTITKHLRFLEKSQWWSKEELKEFQNEKLRDLIKHVYNNVPYYHDIFKEKKLTVDDIKTTDDLVKLPILTKEIIKENFPDRIVAQNIPKSQMTLDGSSGSTGEPLQYYITKDAYSFNIACLFRGWGWAGFDLGDKYVMLSQNPRNKLIKSLQDKAQRCQYVHSQGLRPQDIKDIVEIIRRAKAKFIRGYPSTIYLLSNHIEEEGITDVRPVSVITTGEIVFPYMRKQIESQLQCKVYDTYSGEGGANMSQCHTRDVYHISDEYAFTELVEDGQRIGVEGKGEIVSTNLWNYAVPFIRYNVKDIGVIGGRCSCKRGLSVLQSIEGRDSDILVTPSGKNLIVHFFTGYFEWVETVKQFQVIQEESDRIILKLVPAENFNDSAKEQIYKDVKDYVGDDVNLQVELVTEIPLTKSGKRRFVFSKLKQNLH